MDAAIARMELGMRGFELALRGLNSKTWLIKYKVSGLPSVLNRIIEAGSCLEALDYDAT